MVRLSAVGTAVVQRSTIIRVHLEVVVFRFVIFFIPHLCLSVLSNDADMGSLEMNSY